MMTAVNNKPKHIVPEYRTALVISALLNLAMLFIEGGVGLWTGSAALLADAADFLEDTTVLWLALVASGWSARARAAAAQRESASRLRICRDEPQQPGTNRRPRAHSRGHGPRGRKTRQSALGICGVSRGRYDAQIYTNDKAPLAEGLARDVPHRSAIEASRESLPSAHEIEPSPARSQAQEHTQEHGHSISR